jgi:signal peptidase I
MGKFIRFAVWATIFVGLVVGVARLTAIRWWRVPSDDPWLQASVEPTLSGGDLVLLWRLTEPVFGDLVVCPDPDAPERVVVARLVGERGDRLKFEKGQLELNGKPVQNERECLPPTFEVIHPDNEEPIEQGCSVEDLDGVLHPKGEISGHPFKDTTEETRVPPGEVFLVSDNRLFTYDSRDFGLVPRASCKEAVFYRLWGQTGWKDVKRRLTYIR